MRFLRAAVLVYVLLMISACPKLAEWRDSNVNTMHNIAQSSRIEAPDPPIQLPRNVKQNLPIDPAWIIVSHTNSPAGKNDTVVALAGDDLEATAQWMVLDLMRREYASHDNPSRILEGVEYAFESADLNQEAYYQRLFVHVTMNTASQVVVTLTGWR